ncbi:hypothetical protein HDU82_009141 [Entophlyctis luteolus]|nr:hypothetical protein HDU82_009141 [Entophlyctis luteolus]
MSRRSTPRLNALARACAAALALALAPAALLLLHPRIAAALAWPPLACARAAQALGRVFIVVGVVVEALLLLALQRPPAAATAAPRSPAAAPATPTTTTTTTTPPPSSPRSRIPRLTSKTTPDRLHTAPFATEIPPAAEHPAVPRGASLSIQFEIPPSSSLSKLSSQSAEILPPLAPKKHVRARSDKATPKTTASATTTITATPSIPKKFSRHCSCCNPKAATAAFPAHEQQQHINCVQEFACAVEKKIASLGHSPLPLHEVDRVDGRRLEAQRNRELRRLEDSAWLGSSDI